MSIDVENVCTHGDLDAEVKGKLDRLLPSSYGGSSRPVRDVALRRVLAALTRRTPPIREGDLQNPSELKDAVAFCAAEELYREAITGPDSVHAIQWRAYRDKANLELTSMAPTLQGDLRGAVLSFSVERR